jgi:hypothetical protein
MTPASVAVRAARLLTIALLVGLSVALLTFAVTDWTLSDAEAYWNAAIRLREGESLYPPIDDVEASTVYRYAPWFAVATIPFTFLPIEVAGATWSAVLVAASIWSVVPLIRMGRYPHAFFFGSILIGISAIGNVQPLLVAALVHGLERRSGPLWIAITASLKVVPAIFALVYLGRRQWGRFAVSAVLTVCLVAPMLLFDLSNYVTDASGAAMLFQWPLVWAVVVAAGMAATIRLASTRHGWLAAAATAALALPRFFVYDITFVLPGLAGERNGRSVQ